MKIERTLLDDDKALCDLEDLTKDAKVSGDINEISDDLDSIYDSLQYIGSNILDVLTPTNKSGEDIQDEAQDLIDKIGDYLSENSTSNEEDLYLERIQKMIDSAMAIDKNGKPIATDEVLASSNEKVDDDEIDKIFNEILTQEGYYSEAINLTYSEDDYLESIARDLKESLGEEPDRNQEDVCTSINELYPNLNINFIRSVYDLKEDIVSMYPMNTEVILLHRVNFTDLDELRHFVEIVLDNGYKVNVDEDKMIVDVMKEFKNEDGKILTNIFDIANQAKLLRGIYEGYHVEVL